MKISMAIQPNVNYSALKIHPNPLANPSMTAGYPNLIMLLQLVLEHKLGCILKPTMVLNSVYLIKSPVYFNEFKFENTYLDTKGETNLE